MADLSKYQVYTDAMELANAVMKSHGHYYKHIAKRRKIEIFKPLKLQAA